LYFNSLGIFEFNTILTYTSWPTFNNIKIVAIGQLLFNESYILFIGATLLLFVAMIGVIILTLNKKNKVNYQHKILLKNINWKFK
jgi:NADH:ubiquinone oxidoreductase subunit 6 (subunit J)